MANSTDALPYGLIDEMFELLDQKTFTFLLQTLHKAKTIHSTKILTIVSPKDHTTSTTPNETRASMNAVPQVQEHDHKTDAEDLKRFIFSNITKFYGKKTDRCTLFPLLKNIILDGYLTNLEDLYFLVAPKSKSRLYSPSPEDTLIGRRIREMKELRSLKIVFRADQVGSDIAADCLRTIFPSFFLDDDFEWDRDENSDDDSDTSDESESSSDSDNSESESDSSSDSDIDQDEEEPFRITPNTPFQKLEVLDLSNNNLGHLGLSHIVRHLHTLSSLTTFNIYNNNLTTHPSMVTLLDWANSASLPRLNSLIFGLNHFSLQSVKYFISHDILTRLTRLNLERVPHFPFLSPNLLTSPSFQRNENITSLCLGNSLSQNSLIELFTKTPRLSKLTQLTWSSPVKDDPAVLALTQSSYITELNDLLISDIRGLSVKYITQAPNLTKWIDPPFLIKDVIRQKEWRCGSDARQLRWIGESPYMNSLTQISMGWMGYHHWDSESHVYDHNGQNYTDDKAIMMRRADEDWEVFFNSKNVANLEKIEFLTTNRFETKTFLILAKSPYLRKLKKLVFHGDSENDADLDEFLPILMNSPILETVEHLELVDLYLHDHHLDIIFNSPYLYNFKSLNLWGNNHYTQDVLDRIKAQHPTLAKITKF